MPRGFQLPGFSYAQAPGLRCGGVVVLDAKGREAPLLETSRYGRMVSSRSLGAAYCEVVERMPVVKPDAESGGPRIASPRFPATRTLDADLIPAATEVSAELGGM